jgi:DNA polymerase
MSNASESSHINPVRQLRQHLESLKAAGVSWLPRGARPNPPVEAPVEAAPPATFGPEQEAGMIAEATFFNQPAAGNALTLEDRGQRLQSLCMRVGQCTRCGELAAARKNTVFGVGKIGPDLCFVGEAPGADEDEQGEPFVGAAGQLLNKIIVACGMKREEVYICNIIKCRPPGNRLPLPSEAANCREYLEEQIDLIKPRFICALGACAAQNLLNTTTAIGRLRGQFHQYRGIPVICTYHPAYLLRSPDKKRDVWEDMKKLLAKMGRKVP